MNRRFTGPTAELTRRNGWVGAASRSTTIPNGLGPAPLTDPYRDAVRHTRRRGDGHDYRSSDVPSVSSPARLTATQKRRARDRARRFEGAISAGRNTMDHGDWNGYYDTLTRAQAAAERATDAATDYGTVYVAVRCGRGWRVKEAS